MRRVTVLLLSVVVAAGACSSTSPPPDASATSTPPGPATTAAAQPTTTIDVSAPPTPAQLPAYWNAILATLNRLVGDVFRDVVNTRTVQPAEAQRLRKVYGPSVFPDQYEALVEVAAGKVDGLVIPPGDPVASVTRVVKADGRCVALEASIDYGRVNRTVPTTANAMRLLPRQPSGLADINRANWTIDEFFVIDTSNDGSKLCTS